MGKGEQLLRGDVVAFASLNKAVFVKNYRSICVFLTMFYVWF